MKQSTPSQEPNSHGTNLQRSLKYYQKGVLDPEAWFKVVEEDYAKLLKALHWSQIFSPHQSEYQLLDIGCGTGRFPKMVRALLPQESTIHYDYLDPSQYCLTTCHSGLQPPYAPRHAWQTTLEHASSHIPTGTYDLVWSIQSLYCLNPSSLNEAMSLLLHTLHPSRGTSCIVLAKRDSFFSQAQRLFFQQSTEPAPAPYLDAETVLGSLEHLDATNVIRELPCTHRIAIHQDRLLEQYLQQSVMDTTPLPKWRKNPALRQFLESFRHGDHYQFPNPYWVILSVPASAGPAGKHRLQSYFQPIEPP